MLKVNFYRQDEISDENLSLLLLYQNSGSSGFFSGTKKETLGKFRADIGKAERQYLKQQSGNSMRKLVLSSLNLHRFVFIA